VSSTEAYYFLVDKSLIKPTTDGTLVISRILIARSETKEGLIAKEKDFTQISRIVGVAKAKQVSHELSLSEVNCEAFRIRDLRIWLYDDGGNSIFEFPTDFLRKWSNAARERRRRDHANPHRP